MNKNIQSQSNNRVKIFILFFFLINSSNTGIIINVKPLSSQDQTPIYNVNNDAWMIYKLSDNYDNMSYLTCIINNYQNESISISKYSSQENPKNFTLNKLNHLNSSTYPIQFSNILNLFWIMPLNYNYSTFPKEQVEAQLNIRNKLVSAWLIYEELVENEEDQIILEMEGNKLTYIYEITTNSSFRTTFHYAAVITVELNSTSRLITRYSETFEETRHCSDVPCQVVRKHSNYELIDSAFDTFPGDNKKSLQKVLYSSLIILFAVSVIYLGSVRYRKKFSMDVKK